MEKLSARCRHRRRRRHLEMRVDIQTRKLYLKIFLCFGVLVRELGEWRFYAEFHCTSRKHSGLAWGTIFGKLLRMGKYTWLYKKTMHRVHFLFGVPSVLLPFSFRYAGKVDSEDEPAWGFSWRGPILFTTFWNPSSCGKFPWKLLRMLGERVFFMIFQSPIPCRIGKKTDRLGTIRHHRNT